MNIQKQLIVLSALLSLGGFAFTADPQHGQDTDAQQQQQLTPEQLAIFQQGHLQGMQHVGGLITQAGLVTQGPAGNPVAKITLGQLLLSLGNHVLGQALLNEGVDRCSAFGHASFEAEQYEQALSFYETVAAALQKTVSYAAECYNCGLAAYYAAQSSGEEPRAGRLLHTARRYLQQATGRGYEPAFAVVGEMIYNGYYPSLVCNAQRNTAYQFLAEYARYQGRDPQKMFLEVFPNPEHVAVQGDAQASEQDTQEPAVLVIEAVSTAPAERDSYAAREARGTDTTIISEAQDEAMALRVDGGDAQGGVAVADIDADAQVEDDSFVAAGSVDGDIAAEEQGALIDPAEKQATQATSTDEGAPADVQSDDGADASSAQSANSTASISSSGSSSSSTQKLVPTDESLYEDALRELALADDENDAQTKRNLQRSAYKKLSQAAAMDYMPALCKLALIIFTECPREFREAMVEEQDASTIFAVIGADLTEAAEMNELHPTVACILALYLGLRTKDPFKKTIKKLGISIPQKRREYLRVAAKADDKPYFGRVAYELSCAITGRQQREVEDRASWLNLAAQAGCKEALVDQAEQLCRAGENFKQAFVLYGEAGAKPSSQACIALGRAYLNEKLTNDFVGKHRNAILKGIKLLAQHDRTVCKALAVLHESPDDVLIQKVSLQDAISYYQKALGSLPQKPQKNRRHKGRKGRVSKQQTSYAEKQKAIKQERTMLLLKLAELNEAIGNVARAKQNLGQLLKLDKKQASRALFELWHTSGGGRGEVFTPKDVVSYLLDAQYKQLDDRYYGHVFDELLNEIRRRYKTKEVFSLFCTKALVVEVQGLFDRNLIFVDPASITSEQTAEVTCVRGKLSNERAAAATLLSEDNDNDPMNPYLLVIALAGDVQKCVDVGCALRDNGKGEAQKARCEWCFRLALELGHPEAQFLLGAALVNQKKYDEGQGFLEAALEGLCRDEAIDELLDLADEYAGGNAQGKTSDDSIAIYCVLEEYNIPVVYYQLAKLAFVEGNFATATYRLEQAVSSNKVFTDREDALCLLGLMRASREFGDGKFDPGCAIVYFQQAINCHSSLKAKYNRAMLELVGVNGAEPSSIRAALLLDDVLAEGYESNETDLSALQLFRDCGKTDWGKFAAVLIDLLQKRLLKPAAREKMKEIIAANWTAFGLQRQQEQKAAKEAGEQVTITEEFESFVRAMKVLSDCFEGGGTPSASADTAIPFPKPAVQMDKKLKNEWFRKNSKAASIPMLTTLDTACQYFEQASQLSQSAFNVTKIVACLLGPEAIRTNFFKRCALPDSLSPDAFIEQLAANQELYTSYVCEVWGTAPVPAETSCAASQPVSDSGRLADSIIPLISEELVDLERKLSAKQDEYLDSSLKSEFTVKLSDLGMQMMLPGNALDLVTIIDQVFGHGGPLAKFVHREDVLPLLIELLEKIRKTITPTKAAEDAECLPLNNASREAFAQTNAIENQLLSLVEKKFGEESKKEFRFKLSDLTRMMFEYPKLVPKQILKQLKWGKKFTTFIKRKDIKDLLGQLINAVRVQFGAARERHAVQAASTATTTTTTTTTATAESEALSPALEAARAKVQSIKEELKNKAFSNIEAMQKMQLDGVLNALCAFATVNVRLNPKKVIKQFPWSKYKLGRFRKENGKLLQLLVVAMRKEHELGGLQLAQTAATTTTTTTAPGFYSLLLPPNPQGVMNNLRDMLFTGDAGGDGGSMPSEEEFAAVEEAVARVQELQDTLNKLAAQQLKRGKRVLFAERTAELALILATEGHDKEPDVLIDEAFGNDRDLKRFTRREDVRPLLRELITTQREVVGQDRIAPNEVAMFRQSVIAFTENAL